MFLYQHICWFHGWFTPKVQVIHGDSLLNDSSAYQFWRRCTKKHPVAKLIGPRNRGLNFFWRTKNTQQIEKG